MSLFEKVGKFEALVNKLPRVRILPEAIQRTQKIAAKFEAKLNKLAQDPSAGLDAAIDATRTALEDFFQNGKMPDTARKSATQYYDMLAGLKNPDANGLKQLMEVVKSLGPLVSAAGGANAVVPALSKLYQAAQQKQEELASVPQPGQAAPGQAAAPAAKGFPSIPTNVQNALSTLMTTLNIGIPLPKVDGKLGPDTQQAINNYKKNVPSAAALNGKPLFDKIIQDFKYVHDQQTQGKQPQQILADLKSGTKGQSSDQVFEQGLGKQNLRPPVKPTTAQNGVRQSAVDKYDDDRIE